MDLVRRLIRNFSETEDSDQSNRNEASRERRRSSKIVRVLGQGRNINLDKPGGIAVSVNGTYAVTDTANHKILLFSKVGNLINKFGQPGPSAHNVNSPKDIVFLSNGHLAVTDPLQAKVKVFDPDSATFVTLLSPTLKFQKPTGITATVNDYVIVCDSDSGSITVINPQGLLRNRFDLSNGDEGEVKIAHRPRYVAITRDRTIVVADEATSSIYLFAFSGKPLKIIENSRLRLLGEPVTSVHGLCVDEDDNILMIINDSVCLIMLSGDQLWRLLGNEDDLQLPRCLTCTKDEEIIVGDHMTHSVWIFRHDVHQYRTFRQFQIAAKERRCTL